MYSVGAHSVNLSNTENRNGTISSAREREGAKEWAEWEKIAKHTNHRDKSWSVNPVAYKKCEKILKKSNEMRSKESRNVDDDERRWRKEKKTEKKLWEPKKNSEHNMFKYICWYMISLAIREWWRFLLTTIRVRERVGGRRTRINEKRNLYRIHFQGGIIIDKRFFC